MPFDIIGARSEGYTDQEITDYLGQNNPNFDVGGAIGEGYSLDEVVEHLSQPEPILPSPESPESISPLDTAEQLKQFPTGGQAPSLPTPDVPQLQPQGPSRQPTQQEAMGQQQAFEQQQLSAGPQISPVIATAEGVGKGLTFGLIAPSPEGEIAQKQNPVAFAAGEMAATIGQSVAGGGVVASGLGRIAAIKGSPLLLSTLTRMATSGAISGARNAGEVINNEKAVKDAIWDTVQAIGGAAVSVLPELRGVNGIAIKNIKIPWQAVQILGQPGVDLAYDAIVDSARGKDVGSKDWWLQEAIGLGISTGFAIKDVTSGKEFKVTSEAMQKDAKGGMDRFFRIIKRFGKNPDDIEITPLKAAPGAPDIAPKTEQIRFGEKVLDPKEIDTLTKLPNQTVTKKAVAEVPGDHFTASIDGDNFKAVNDVFGHAEGDKVLTQLGDIINKHFPEEFRGREGGEEFFIDLGTKFDESTIEKVKAFQSDVADNIKVGPNNEPFTLSIGVGQGKYESPTGQMELNSDHASFKAKENGRNQIAVDRNGEIEYHIGSDPGKKDYLLKFSRKQAESAIDVLKKGGEIEPGRAEEIKSEIRKPKEKAPVSRPEVPAKPPEVKPKPTAEPEKVVGLNKRENEHIRDAIGATKLSDAQKKTHKATFEQVKAERADEKAVEVADDVLRSNRQMTDAEHVGAVLKVGKLLDEYNDKAKTISKLIGEGNSTRAREEAIAQENLAGEIDKITLSTRNARRETARALSIGRLKVKSEVYDLASVTQRARATKGKKLSAKEQAKFETLTKEHEVLQKRHDALNKKYEEDAAKREKLLAQRTVQKLLKRRSAPMEKIMSERTDIEKQLTDIGFRLNDITGLTSEGSYLVGKLAVNYIKEAHSTVEGKIEMAGIVKKVKEKIPDVSEQEIYRALNAKDPKRVIKARSEASKEVQRLKTIAKLRTDIEDTAEGAFSPKKKKPVTDTEIKSLRSKLRDMRSKLYESKISEEKLEKAVRAINEYQDMLTNQYRSVKKKQKPTDPELAALRIKQKELRRAMKIDDDLADIDQQLRTGKFKDTGPKKRIIPEGLERAEIMLSRKRKELQQKIASTKPLKKREVISQIAGTTRTLMTIGEVSGWLRQNVVPVVSHPIRAAQIAPTSMKATFSEYQFDKMDQAIRDPERNPNAYLYDKSGLKLRELDGKASTREETFRSNWLEKVPVLGKIVRGSERSMASVGNLMRTTLFDDFLIKHPNATHDELTAYADFLNKATGIGDLKGFKGAAEVLSVGFFSPAFTVSRFQTPLGIIKHWKKPRVRKQVARDLGGFVGTGMTVLGLAALALKDEPDTEVGDDMRSPDWGKIRIGNQRWDIWGGFQQPARLVARLGIYATDRVGVTGKDVSEEMKDIDPLDLLWRFASYRRSPMVGLGAELFTGKTAVGEDVEPLESVVRHITPLFFQDIIESYRKQGLKSALVTVPTAGTGIGTSTYGSAYKRVLRVKKEYNALVREKKFEAAKKFLGKNKRDLEFASSAKSIDKSIKSIEKARDHFKESGNKAKAKEMEEKIRKLEDRFKEIYSGR